MQQFEQNFPEFSLVWGREKFEILSDTRSEGGSWKIVTVKWQKLAQFWRSSKGILDEAVRSGGEKGAKRKKRGREEIWWKEIGGQKRCGKPRSIIKPSAEQRTGIRGPRFFGGRTLPNAIVQKCNLGSRLPDPFFGSNSLWN